LNDKNEKLAVSWPDKGRGRGKAIQNSMIPAKLSRGKAEPFFDKGSFEETDMSCAHSVNFGMDKVPYRRTA